MDFKINGSAATADADPDEPAVDVLRDRLGLTGTKLVCGTGVCGACTILVDGSPRVSCLTPCGALTDRDVTTVEGLGEAHRGPGETHPVQRAFAAEDGLQCGYCTPGFVVESAAFVDRWRAAHGDTRPSRTQIAEALAGHLCRCGAYEGIFAAAGAACAGEYDAPARDGAAARIEAMDKVTGRARYTTDIRLDRQLEGVIVRSTQPHARIVSVEGGAVPMVELLGPDRVVRYAGEPIAAVAAPSRAEALAAAANVTVTYEPLPAVVDTDAAARPDAPVVYPDPQIRKSAPNASESLLAPAKWRGNVRGPGGGGWRGGTALRRIEEARERGDELLVTGRFSTAVQVHTPLEPHACVARWDGEELHVHVSTQSVDKIAKDAKKRWNAERVHVVADHVGGGFGAKQGIGVETVAAVELARACGAPVRVVLSREEELTDGGNRPGTRTELSLLTGKDGKPAALSVDVHGDGGVSVGSAVATMALLMYGNAPRKLRDFDVVTNRPPGKPFRGPGAAPLHWALEQAVDETAHRLGEDPIALRQRWDGNPKRQALYEVAGALPLWRERPATGSQTGRFRRGVGVAAANWIYLLDPGTEVELTVEQGVVVARTAVQDIGTGIRTVLAGVLRDALDLPADRIRVQVGRSGTVHGPTSGGSRTTTSVGPAAQDAARRLRAALPGAPAGSVGAALEAAEGLTVVGRRPRDRRGYLTPFEVGGVQPGRGFSGAVHVTEVQVDTLLGKIRATRVWGGVAAGHIYAERLARGQCEGGIIQGIGFALYEERHIDPETGALVSSGLEDYHIPGIGDTPQIELHFHTEGWDHVAGRGVGIGEVATVGVAASVGNAVHNATGWRPRDLPIRPDRLLAGITR